MRRTLRSDLDMANGCLGMVAETLEGLGTDMEHTPPMFYPEAIYSTMHRLLTMQRAGEVEYDEATNVYRRKDGKPFSGAHSRGKLVAK